MRAVIVGAGIGGLAAAWHLQKRGAEVTVLEASDRPGGAIRTRRQDGFLLEEGPDSFLTAKPHAIALAKELGLEPIGTNSVHRRSFILRGERLVPVPEGFYLLAPSSLGALVRAPIFSWTGKARMALEPLVPARRDGADESLASFVRRRLGREALERFAQPMVGGIYTADPEKLSLAATMPQFLQMEREHGSVVRALAKRGAAPKGTSGPRYSLFASFEGGMQALVDALASQLTIRCGVRVEDPKAIDADAVVLAAPLLPELGEIPRADSATVNLAFDRDQVGHPLDGMGFVVPLTENRDLLSCSFSSTKFAGRAPEGKILLRAFAGGAMQPDRYALDDRTLLGKVLADLRAILSIRGDPLFALVHRHPASMPQYHLGHLEKAERIERSLPPNVALAGNTLRGSGVPDCIASGEAAAARLLP